MTDRRSAPAMRQLDHGTGKIFSKRAEKKPRKQNSAGDPGGVGIQWITKASTTDAAAAGAAAAEEPV